MLQSLVIIVTHKYAYTNPLVIRAIGNGEVRSYETYKVLAFGLVSL